jgi:hypothetical protein
MGMCHWEILDKADNHIFILWSAVLSMLAVFDASEGRAMAQAAGLSPQRPRPVQVGFVVDEVKLGEVSL